MNQTALMTEAAAVTVDLARGIKPDQFDAATPYSEYDGVHWPTTSAG